MNGLGQMDESGVHLASINMQERIHGEVVKSCLRRINSRVQKPSNWTCLTFHPPGTCSNRPTSMHFSGGLLSACPESESVWVFAPLVPFTPAAWHWVVPLKQRRRRGLVVGCFVGFSGRQSVTRNGPSGEREEGGEEERSNSRWRSITGQGKWLVCLSGRWFVVFASLFRRKEVKSLRVN